MARRQFLEWGYIDWLYEPSENSGDNIRVGISTVLPGTVQPRHFHYGDEQLMYVISGHGRQRIGEEESVIEPGKIFHISTGCAHESMNDGEEPIVKLLVSVPAVTAAPSVEMREPAGGAGQEKVDKSAFLQNTVQELLHSMLAPLKLPLIIYDAQYNAVYCSELFPDYCKIRCGIDKGLDYCDVLHNRPSWVPPYYEGASACVCPYGLWVCTRPIVAKGELLGFIRAGFVRTESQVRSGTDALPYQVPESTVRGIVQVTEKLAESICTHYEMTVMQVELRNNMRELSDQKAADAMLQESLKTSQGQALNLQINQHFLFNTLNTIAGMSIREGAIQTYNAVGSLAQLLRYTLRTNSYFVRLGEEMDYVRNYLSLQKLRFGSKLTVNEKVPCELYDLQVPFNFLQPVVENCFKHGFAVRRDKMEIGITVERIGGILRFRIADNGDGMSPEQLETLREKLRTGSTRHGSVMVLRKLESLYGNNVNYTVDADSNGTTVTIDIPADK